MDRNFVYGHYGVHWWTLNLKNLQNFKKNKNLKKIKNIKTEDKV